MPLVGDYRIWQTHREPAMQLRNPRDSISAVEGAELHTYFHDACSISPMTSEEEQRVGQQIQSRQDGWEDAATELARRNTRLVVYIAKMFVGRGVPLADLIGAGNIGLIKAARRFRVDRGARFVTYAVWWIRQACRREIANHSCTVRVPSYIYENRMRNGRTHASTKTLRAASTAWQTCSIEAIPVYLSASQTVVETTVKREQSARVHHAVENLKYLDPRLPDVLRRRFGLSPYQDEQTFDEIARTIGVSKQRVQQITVKGLHVLRLSMTEEP